MFIEYSCFQRCYMTIMILVSVVYKHTNKAEKVIDIHNDHFNHTHRMHSIKRQFTLIRKRRTNEDERIHQIVFLFELNENSQ